MGVDSAGPKMSGLERVTVTYRDRVVRQFAFAGLAWGGLALVVGIAHLLALAVPGLDTGAALHAGRLRGLHVTLVGFALLGNLGFAAVYWSCQRLLGVRLPRGALGALHVWGWQVACALGVAGLVAFGNPPGQSGLWAGFPWPVDLAFGALWMVFAVNLAAMIRARRERRLYVAVWFYLAAAVTFAFGFAIGNLAVPTGLLTSTSPFAGLVSAFVQLWSDHTLGWALSMPLLGLAYHLLPVVSGRPLYSHRLAVIHFWGLVLVVGFAAPWQVLHTPLPDGLQSFAVMIGRVAWAPSLAFVCNGLLTLRGAGARIGGDPVLKFLVMALSFFGVWSLASVAVGTRAGAELAQFTDLMVGHRYLFGFGFGGFVIAAALYHLVPRLYGTKLRSIAAAQVHFYLATVGVLFYVGASALGGATQGVMWQAQDAAGGLTYEFMATVLALDIPKIGQLLGGGLYLIGFFIMAGNLAATAGGGAAMDGRAQDAGTATDTATAQVDATDGGVEAAQREGTLALVVGGPVLVAACVAALLALAQVANAIAAFTAMFVACIVGGLALALVAAKRERSGDLLRGSFHGRLETSGSAIATLVGCAVATATVGQLVPVVRAQRAALTGIEADAPASADGAGDFADNARRVARGGAIYLREGCDGCHTQLVRPFLWEVARYGEVTMPKDVAAATSPRWGTRRIGPDLAREGGKRTDAWHRDHLRAPAEVTAGSVMPSFAHLSGDEGAALIAYLQSLGQATPAPPSKAPSDAPSQPPNPVATEAP